MKIFMLCLCMVYAVAQESLEEQVGQLLIACVHSDRANECTYKCLKKYQLGGVILYNWCNQLSCRAQVQALTQGLQDQAKQLGLAELLIATDQEGGVVARLKNGFTEFPGNGALGRADSEELVTISAQAMAEQMRAVGINFVFAPVVDVNASINNPVIGVRSYGNDAEQVARFGLAAVRGFASCNLLSCLKHFPGHGDVSVDSHVALPVLNKSYAELVEVDLKPFEKSLQVAPAIMSAHIRVPALDKDACATLSKPILTDLLRIKMGYQGVIVSDSLTMAGVLKECGGDIGEAAVRSIEAGADLLIIGGRTLNDDLESLHEKDLQCVQDALIAAVRAKRICVQPALERIRALKARLGHETVQENLTRAENCAREIAERSVRGTYPDLWDKKVAIIAPPELQVAAQCLKNNLFHVDLQQADTVIFLSHNAWKDPDQARLLHKLSTKYFLVLIAARDPRDAKLPHNAQAVITTLSPSAPSMQVVSDRLVRALAQKDIQAEQVRAIGRKIWMNECGGRKDQLLYWKEGEQWPSVGIGHFIWPPKSYEGNFKAGRFHHVLEYFKAKKVNLPSWLGRYSPWQSAEAFASAKGSPEMKELEALILSTIDLQAQYMTQRLWESIPNLVADLNAEQRRHLLTQVRRLAATQEGLFALIDYLNFKHEGTAEAEEYQGVRFGLKQVLLGMSVEEDPIEGFVASAKKQLRARVEAAPLERDEKKWIPGWFNRLDRYLSF